VKGSYDHHVCHFFKTQKYIQEIRNLNSFILPNHTLFIFQSFTLFIILMSMNKLENGETETKTGKQISNMVSLGQKKEYSFGITKLKGKFTEIQNGNFH